MRYDRDKRPGSWWITSVALSMLLLGWRLSGAGTPDRRAARSPAPASREATTSPDAARMLWHLLAWAAGGIAIIGVVWMSAQIWMARREADAVARALTGGEPANAAALVTRYGCGGCHTIPGLPGAEGQVGPPLSGLRQRVFIAGVLPNTADNLINWIVTPRRFSPGSAMPRTGIGTDGARDVAAYLYAH